MIFVNKPLTTHYLLKYFSNYNTQIHAEIEPDVIYNLDLIKLEHFNHQTDLTFARVSQVSG